MDKTKDFLDDLRSLVEKTMVDDVYLSLPRIQSDLDFLIKVKAIKNTSTLAAAARSINVKRTTLYEYIKNKLSMGRKEVIEIDLERWQ